MLSWWSKRPQNQSGTKTLCNRPAGQQDVPPEVRIGSIRGHEPFEWTVQDIAHHYEKGNITCLEYVNFCVRSIHAINPYIEAVIEVNLDAPTIAKQLDDEKAAGTTRGPLHGIPVLVKDNMATQDGMQTTAGSWALLGGIVPQDATVVSLLRQAGAVIIGHANMSEWASCRSKAYSTGYSPRGGQVRNPYDLRKSPFGSSSGSAAAVAANIVPIALGTETDTSIIGPASINGVVGIKPTVGLTSRAGVIPISENMDSVGSFGRTVADAVTVLDAIAGEDPKDPFTLTTDRYQDASYLRHLATSEVLRGARFGRPHKRCWQLVPAECKAVAQEVFEALVEAGAEIAEVELPSVEERTNPDGNWDWEHGSPEASEWTVARVDAYNNINLYLSELQGTDIKSIEDVIEYNKQNKGTEGPEPSDVPAFPTGHDDLVAIADSKGVKDDIYHTALAHIRKQTRENGLDDALTGVDALLFCDRRGIGQQYAAQAGYPIICIPIGLDEQGMPVSMSIQHSAWKEAELIKWASAIEDLWNRKKGWRATPTFKNRHAKNIPIEPVG